jgi:hypothetical protein
MRFQLIAIMLALFAAVSGGLLANPPILDDWICGNNGQSNVKCSGCVNAPPPGGTSVEYTAVVNYLGATRLPLSCFCV